MESHQKIYAARRAQVLNQMQDDSAMLVAQNHLCIRNNDTDYPFRPDSRFYYLTGFTEPSAFLLLLKQGGKNTVIFFCQDKDPLAERWNGKRLGVELAKKTLGVDEVYDISQLDKIVKEKFKNISFVHFVFNEAKLEPKVALWLEHVRQMRGGIKAPTHLVDAREIIDELRLFKDTHEIALMQKAADISVAAHTRAIQYCRPGLYEYQLEAEYLHTFYQEGSRYPAYPSIVGGGTNACILHYVENNALLNPNELVLVDAGCEFGLYASDITRTYPISGQFTQAQKAIYQIVLDAQLAGIQAIKPGLAWDGVQKIILQIMVKGLVDVGLLKGNVDELIEKKAYLPFYMHNSGHWLGLDVHDVGQYKINGNWRPLAPNMVLTVEPGIYIDKDADVPPEFKGIGIRIEDDVLVTDQGHRVLTANLVKEVSDLEALQRS